MPLEETPTLLHLIQLDKGQKQEESELNLRTGYLLMRINNKKANKFHEILYFNCRGMSTREINAKQQMIPPLLLQNAIHLIQYYRNICFWMCDMSKEPKI